jgi:hypothetical protein
MAVSTADFDSSAAIRRKHKKKRRPDELPYAAASPPTNGKKLGAQEVIALQKLLGNKATQEVLHKQQKEPTSEDAATKERFINKHVREMVKTQLKERMTEATDNYTAAWESFRKELGVEASFNPELGESIIKAFMTNHGSVSDDLFKQVGEQFPLLLGPGMNNKTLASLDPEKEQEEFLEDKGKDPVEDAAEKVVKEVKAAGANPETQIIKAIKDQILRIVEELDDFGEEEMTDLDLLLLWSNFEEKIVKEELYKVLVKIIVGEAKKVREAQMRAQRQNLGHARGKGSAAAAAAGGDGGGGSGSSNN